MSLFNAPSEVLRLIQEFKLSADEAAPMPDGDSAGISDVATELTSSTPPPPPPTAGPGMATMTVPGAPAAPAMQDPTLTKKVINSSIVLAHLNSLRQSIAAAENVFKKGDAGVEDASSALTALQLQISSISTVLTSFISAASTPAQPAAPSPEVPPVAPAPEAGTTPPEPPPAPVEKPNLGPV